MASNVSIDLMGFEMVGTPASLDGVSSDGNFVRAVTVANELVVMGVPRERITTVGFGSQMPRANEQCNRQQREELSRNMNRRVEFSLLVCR